MLQSREAASKGKFDVQDGDDKIFRVTDSFIAARKHGRV